MSLSVQPAASHPYAESGTSLREREPGSRTDATPAVGKSAAKATNLSEQDRKVVEELKARDREVRAHEQAHVAAAGGLARGGPSYTFQYGPDGRVYAVGGEVDIDTSPGRTPEETVSKAKQIRAAALAPADPSGQDRAVAAAASKLEAQAQQELAQKAISVSHSDQETPGELKPEVESGEPTGASDDNAQSNPRTRQAAAQYGSIASGEKPEALIQVSA
jgi:hypothetical protein